ncbi:MAG: signal peptide peptidase SppA [Lutibacter sp.]|uniref:signal peptide peptidase SppA n=1 Tax=Lutibacter sp. TaxID=1925666 RepID=UPI001820B6AF|nr:signal peptide peptidase SppA [Lutibacter sp.]MBT8317606.1 signal peptide peptidase SppA [Lutibacter sp.]NNJ58465.1 signal peptide peptidase SppA [Lutibacter sp.]
MNFLRNLFASIFGTLIALGIILVLFLLVAAAVGDTKKVSVASNSILEIQLEELVKDYAPKSENPLDEIFGFNDAKIGLNTIINAIENAKYDEKIKGISITSLGVNAGIAQTQAIRNKLVEFKESGKFVMAYADMFDQKSYYFSSVADSIFLNPVGAIDFKGLSSEILFYKDLEDKTGVTMEVIRHGKYKSAVEPFLYNEMSADNREQISAFLTSIWDEMVVDISTSRELTEELVNNIADNLLGRNATLAIESKLVDEALYFDEYMDKLKLAVGLLKVDKLSKVSIQDYIASGKGRVLSSASDKIAVIYAQGEIIYGKGNEDVIGQDLIINALRKATESKSVKAIVLRVNSPGGSALASELIWREMKLAGNKKPIVVSMGNVAASGGYYIACSADRIFAEPTTITGSIGVFGVIPNMSNLANKIGINAEQVSTNKGASYSVFEPMSNEFRSVTTEGVEAVYTTFLERVADGRNMEIEDVDAIAQGRVWSGVDALNNGLVDELGNLDAAVSYAAELAETTDYKVRNYPSYNIDLEDRFSSFPFMKTKEKVLIEELGEDNYKIYKSIKALSKLKGIQTRLPFMIEIK